MYRILCQHTISLLAYDIVTRQPLETTMTYRHYFEGKNLFDTYNMDLLIHALIGNELMRLPICSAI